MVNLDRRNFLQRALSLSIAPVSLRLGGVSMLSLAAGLPKKALSMVDCEGTGPRSLVCVFLAGGADSFNMFVPVDNRFAIYQATRNDLAVAEADLLEVSGDTAGSFAFHRLLDGFHALYNNQQLAVVSNVGPLLRPTSQADYRNRNTIPQSLFAHDAQQRLWQTAAGQVSGTEGFGWGGGIAEQIAGCNSGAGIGGAFSISGANAWQSARNADYVSLSPNANIERLYGFDASAAGWIPEASRSGTASILSQLLQDADTVRIRHCCYLVKLLTLSVARSWPLNSSTVALDTFQLSEWQASAANPLEAQLHLVARLIAARSQLTMDRQIFFVRMGGWDTHSNQNERLPLLLTDLNHAITQFQQALNTMGLQDSVTTFTASDFGRTLTSNGNGTDHGWGGHNFVIGGAVRGGQLYGDLPSYASTGNANDAGDDDNFAGRIIPTLSVNQYGATLARWMGVADNELNSLFPDLINFETTDLGFMQG